MQIRELSSAAELAAADAVARRVWRTDVPIVSGELLRALVASGGYVAGAFDAGELVGVAVGLLALHEGRVELHSHLAGMVAGARRLGGGVALKVHQRSWALDRGIETITWTFDPLVRRNALFNLARLGAEATDYLVDFYGPMSDGVNAGQGSDRWWVRWALRDPAVEAALAGTPAFADPPPGAQLCATPDDIEALRAADPAAAVAARAEQRRRLAGALAAGCRVAGVTRDGSYVLVPR